jgi:hypothetical protein
MNRVILAAMLLLVGLTVVFALATGEHGSALAGGLEWGHPGP